MFYKIKCNSYPNVNSFVKTGFYWVEYEQEMSLSDDIYWFNKHTGSYIAIDLIQNVPVELLNMFEEKPEDKNTKVLMLDTDRDSGISESLFLKAMVIMKSDVDNVELKDLL